MQLHEINQELKKEFYNKLPYDKIQINWNKNPIPMKLFLSFLTVSVKLTTDHLGYDTGWSQRVNEDLKLIVKGGSVDGVEYLDNIQYGTKLSNSYNNYVNPFYLFPILTHEGRMFFIDYYKDEIEKLFEKFDHAIDFHKRQQQEQELMLKMASDDIARLSTKDQAE